VSTPRWDVLIVGAGYAGAVMAERCAAAGRSVLVIDRREHIAGNAYDHPDAHGVTVHDYGPHIFHTNSDEVVAYLSRFTAWRPYEHRVRARVGEELYPIPINRLTLAKFFDREVEDEAAARALLEEVREPRAEIRTSEDVVIDAVGRELYEAFFRGYTRKQWHRDPSELDRSVCARIPTRTDDDCRYFTDAFQQMPADGYTAMFRRILDHPNITVEVGTAYDAARHRPLARHLVWTGPVDRFFDRRFGELPYRSLRFEHQHRAGVDRAQSVGTINEPQMDVPYTRTTEFKHLTGQDHDGTSLVREYPLGDGEGDPYYPIPNPETKALYDRYKALADSVRDVTFVGRLAQYRYYNMDQVVAAALTRARDLLGDEAVRA